MIWLGIIIGYVTCAFGSHYLRQGLEKELVASRLVIESLNELLRLEKEQAAKDVNRWKCVALDKPWPEEP